MSLSSVYSEAFSDTWLDLHLGLLYIRLKH